MSNQRNSAPSVQLITFGKRGDGTGSFTRPQHDNRSYNNPWQQSLIYKNGVRENIPEREQLLAPVKLDPGWDSMSNPKANKQMTLSQHIEELENNPPRDRFHIVYIILLIHGIAVLIPWNMFINAKSYFEEYKLNQGNSSSAELRDYKTNFMSYLGMASQYPNFIMNIINLFVQCKGNTLGARILTAIVIMIIMFVLTVVLAVIDTSAWPETFFWITMATAVVINAAVGIYQSSIFGISAVLPMKYTNAVIFGNNMSGTLVAVTNIIVLLLSPSQKSSAIYYFVVAIIILSIGFDAYFITAHCKFYTHYQKLAELKKQAHDGKGINTSLSYKQFFQSFGRVFKQIYHLLFGVWFTFFISLSLFPVVMSDVLPMEIPMSRDYWTAIFCFLFFNLFATLGNLTTEFIRWPSARWINILIILRVGFVPLMILGNFRPDLRTLPVYIPYDWVFIATAVLFSFTSGYCSSLVMMYAPKCVSTNDSAIAGMTMALFLVFGILSGINFSRVWSIVIGSK